MDQRGFTLIELLVVVLIIGILAAIALPVFLGQKEKSQDASAKSDARNAVSQIESCFTTTYAGCDTYSGRPANVAVTIDTPKSAYTVVATSKAANSGRTFTIKLETNGTRTRSCTPDGGGCDGTSW